MPTPLINLAYHTPNYKAQLDPVGDWLESRGVEVDHNLPPGEAALTLTTHFHEVTGYIRHDPVVFINHGVCPKRGHAGDLRRGAALGVHFLFTGPYSQQLLETVAPGYPNQTLTGYPKADKLVGGTTDEAKEIVTTEYGLTPTRPLVLFAPTWYGEASHGTLAQFPSVVAACEALDCELIVAPHERDRDHSVLAALPGSRVCLQPDKNPLLKAADVMVSDFSGLTLEFCLLDRPIIQLTDAIEGRLESMVGPHHPAWVEQFVVGAQTKAANLQEPLAEALAGHDRYRQERREWVGRVFHKPGEATQLAGEALLKIAEADRQSPTLGQRWARWRWGRAAP